MPLAAHHLTKQASTSSSREAGQNGSPKNPRPCLCVGLAQYANLSGSTRPWQFLGPHQLWNNRLSFDETTKYLLAAPEGT